MVKRGQRIRLWIARRRNDDCTRVWYEWRLVEPVMTVVQNWNGKYKDFKR